MILGQRYPNWIIFTRLYTLDQVGVRIQWCKQHFVFGQWDATIAFARQDDGSSLPEQKQFGFENLIDAILFKLRWDQC